jgi:hypothetical protein
MAFAFVRRLLGFNRNIEENGDAPPPKAAPDYVYSDFIDPKAQIRLLILLPASESHPDIIEGKLVRVDFLQDPVYEALSYEWGDKDADRELVLDGHAFRVRKNLWQALRNLRTGTERAIWVDAICVDQTNLRERNHQVAQMSQIFSRAKNVLIWLGSDDEQNSAASVAIDAIKSRKYISWRPGDLLPGQLWPTLADFLGHSYFGRLWIVQEVILAQRLQVHCESNSVEWSDFERMCDHLCGILKNHGRTLPVLQNSVAFKLRERRRLRQKGSLLPLLETCRYSLCRDPRDKIFGLLGLVDDLRVCPRTKAEELYLDADLIDREIRADYLRSPFEIYEDMVRFQNYRLFPRHFAEYCSAKALAEANTIAFSEFLIGYMSHGAASNPFHDYINHLASQQTPRKDEPIWVVGHSGCHIASVGPSAGAVLQDDSVIDTWMRKLQKYDLPSGFKFRYHHKALTEAIRGYNKGTNDSTKVTAIDSSLSSVSNFRKDSLEKIMAKDGDRTPGHDESAYPRMPENIYLYAADDGEIGLGPSTMEKGDLICRFPDCTVIAIIRLVGFDKYEIIGRALKGIGNKKGAPPPPPPFKERRFGFRLDVLTLFLLTR